MTDEGADYGERRHEQQRATDTDWIRCLQEVLDEVTADLMEASPTGRAFDGTSINESIEESIRPLVACTWAELTQVASHSWLSSTPIGVAHLASWPFLLRSAEIAARHSEYPGVIHHHLKGEKCNRRCRLVRPVQTPSMKGGQ